MEFKRVMRRYFLLLAALLPLMGALGAVPAEARLGGGHSFGSRGTHSFYSPRPTTLAPGAAPMERSQPAMQGRPGLGMGGSMFGRHPFATGLLGGLLGAGIFGMLFGGGFFHSGLGFGGLFGTIIQLVILFFLIRFVMRLFMNRRTGASPGRSYAPAAGAAGWQGVNAGMGGGVQPLQLTPADQAAFQQCLVYVQQAWSSQDMAAVARAATPEMVGYFNEQLDNLQRRGLRNRVADINVEKMELSEAWSEGDQDYATVAMRFSMLDVTEDSRGQVVDGSLTTRALVTEIWTFTRRRGGHWILAAIQQTR
jgi:predicted lipid-binding transport protein (Tim44 family)